jgi:hypothetical protein
LIAAVAAQPGGHEARAKLGDVTRNLAATIGVVATWT